MNQVGDAATRNHAAIPDDSVESSRAARPEERPADRSEEPNTLVVPGLWDVAGVSAFLGVPVSAIYKMTARAATVRIPHIRLGGRLRFRPQDIDRWLSQLTTSNHEALARIRQKALKVTHGHYP